MPEEPLNESLLRATQRGDLAAAAHLLDRGADVNATARLSIPEPGRLDTLTWRLLEWEASKGITPLQLAAWYGHTEIARLLLDRGADIDNDGRWETAILIAAEQEHQELMRLLLDRGADINRGWSDDRTFLFHVQGGRTMLVRALLERGMDVDARDSRGRTPLMWAAALSDDLHGMFERR
jgi:ankyrin repeat protein